MKVENDEFLTDGDETTAFLAYSFGLELRQREKHGCQQ